MERNQANDSINNRQKPKTIQSLFFWRKTIALLSVVDVDVVVAPLLSVIVVVALLSVVDVVIVVIVAPISIAAVVVVAPISIFVVAVVVVAVGFSHPKGKQLPQPKLCFNKRFWLTFMVKTG